MDRRLRVAVTLEQCWHAVPGRHGARRARVVRAAARPTTTLDLVGVSARHSAPPPDAVGAADPGRAPSRCPGWRCTSPGTGCGDPRCERATGPVDVIHATGMAMPPPSAADRRHRARPGVPARPGAVHAARGRSFFRRALDLARRDADLVMCPSQATLDDCATPRLRPGAAPAGAVGRSRPSRSTASGVAGVRARLGLAGPLRAVDRHHRAPQEPARPARRLRRARPRRRRPSCWSARRAGTRTSAPAWPGWATGSGASASSTRRPSRRCTPGPRCSASRASRRGSACRCSRRWPRAPPVDHLDRHGDRRGRRRRRPSSSTRATPARSTAALARLLDDDDERRAARRRPVGSGPLGVLVGGDCRRPRRRARGGRRSRVGHGSGGVRRRHAPDAVAPVRVGVNLLWLVPGEVGGSEEYTVAAAAAPSPVAVPDDLEVTLYVNGRFAGRPRRPRRAVPHRGGPGRRHVATAAGGGGVDVAGGPRLARPDRRRAPRRGHHAARAHRARHRDPARPPAAHEPRALRPGEAHLHPR